MLGSRTEGPDVGAVVAKSEAHAGETAPQRIGGKDGEPLAGLAEILDVVGAQQLKQRDQVAPAQDGGLARLIEAEATGKDGETHLQRGGQTRRAR